MNEPICKNCGHDYCTSCNSRKKSAWKPTLTLHYGANAVRTEVIHTEHRPLIGDTGHARRHGAAQGHRGAVVRGPGRDARPVRRSGGTVISQEPPTECPRCRVESPCVDYNEVDIGVGYQRFDHAYRCPTHGEFGFGPQTGEPIFREGEPAA